MIWLVALVLWGEAATAGSSDLDHVRDLLAQGEYGEAETAARAALAAVAAEQGAGSLAAAQVMDLLVEAMLQEGEWKDPEAREFGEKAVAIKEERLGSAHDETAASLGRLGRLLTDAGDYGAARPLLERAVAINEGNLGPPPNLLLAENLHRLGILSWWTGDYEQAREAWERSLAIRERDLGPEDPAVIKVLGSLALVLEDLGDYTESRRYYERVLATSEKTQPDHPSTATHHSNFGLLLWRMGDYAAAEIAHRRALAIRERVLRPEHPLVGASLNNLAILYRAKGDYEQARALYERSLEIKEKNLGAKHPYVANTLNNLGNIYLDMGDYGRAEALHRRALAAREKVLGPEHPEVAKSLENLGDTLYRAGRGVEARPLHERAVEIRERALGSHHPWVAESLVDLALTLWDLGEVPPALKAALRAEAIGRDHLQLTMRSLPERQALRYAADRPSSLDFLLTLAAEGVEAARSRSIWDSLVRSRAVVLDEMAARNRVLSTAENPEVTRLAEAYGEAAARLAKLTLSGPGSDTGAYAASLEEALREKERAEQGLAAKSSLFRQQVQLAGIGLAQARRALPPESALVAYVRYEHHWRPKDFSPAGGSREGDRKKVKPVQTSLPSYLAFVLGSAASNPRVIALGSAREVEDRVRRWRDEVLQGWRLQGRSPRAAEAAYRRAGEGLRRQIWDPLVPHLGPARRVFVVPDGALHLVNLAALPVGSERYLLEDGPVLHHLSAERDLVRPPAAVPESGRQSLLVLGGPDYDAPSLFAALGRPEKSTLLAVLRPVGEFLSALSPFRGGASTCEAFHERRFETLPAAQREAEQVERLWRRAGGKASDLAHLTGAAASEEAFRKLAPGRRVLHLATHGFFLGGRCASALGGTEDFGAASVGENPLLLSGLALAGANHRGVAAPDEEDGILTAEEIGALDLSGVEWAVLSGCDTGRGEIEAGEGVLGLRRAFQVAGVRTLIMSLWPVQDELARRWMESLYEARLIDRLSSAQAVRQASLTVLEEQRRAGASTHPFYWAGFVAAGDWR